MSVTQRRRIRGADRSQPVYGNAESTTSSVTLEIIERLAAALAAPQRLAGGRAEFGQQFGVLGTALRARHLLLAEQRAARARCLRRRDAVFPELSPPPHAAPCRGPGRRQPGPK